MDPVCVLPAYIEGVKILTFQENKILVLAPWGNVITYIPQTTAVALCLLSGLLGIMLGVLIYYWVGHP
jgi:hypothetical protein